MQSREKNRCVVRQAELYTVNIVKRLLEIVRAIMQSNKNVYLLNTLRVSKVYCMCTVGGLLFSVRHGNLHSIYHLTLYYYNEYVF